MQSRPKKTNLCQPIELPYQKHFGLFVDVMTKYPEQVVYERVIKPKIDEIINKEDECFIVSQYKK